MTIAVLLSACLAAGAAAQTGGGGQSSTTSTTTTSSSTSSTTSTTRAPGVKPKVLVVGDSSLHALETSGDLAALQQGLASSELTFDAADGRSTVVGAGVVLSKRPSQFDTIVIGLGLDDRAEASVIAERATTLLTQLQGVPHVLWLTLREAGTSSAKHRAVNAALRGIVRGMPNTALVDWNALAATLPTGQLAADQQHVTNASAPALANLIVAAVNGSSPYLVTSASLAALPLPTIAPSTTERASSGSRSNMAPLIGGVAGALVVALIVGVLLWRRRRRSKRRAERGARLDQLFGGDSGAD